MKKILLQINNAILDFMTDHVAKILGIVIIVTSGLLFLTLNRNLKPETTADFAKTAVKVVNLTQDSGGTGVIISSSPFGTKVLTNKHVCRLIETGGYVIYNSQAYLIDSYKKYPKHDLCLLSIIYDFGVTIEVAKYKPTNFSNASIIGHPALFPPVLTKGHFSGRENVQLITGLQKCDEKTPPEYVRYCLFFGGIPIIEIFSAQLVTATILPGSSGSGVFNSDGELSGLVFSGKGEGLNYGFIVPHEYVVNFLETESDLPWVKAGKGHNYKEFFQRIFNFQSECNNGLKFKNLCDIVENYLIWMN